jgi:hypothetical protein
MAASAHAALWVSPVGDDANPGTEEQPLRTLERARDVVRTLNHDMADDITVFIDGEHHLGRPLELGPEDSGTNGFNIVYTAAPGDHPVISGGTRVVGWALADPARNLWSAPAPPGLDDARALFVNGNPAGRTRARLLAVFSRGAQVAAAGAPGPQAQWKNPADVAFEPPGSAAIWSERTGQQAAFVANAFELLGTPGQWYMDRPARRLYYVPRSGEAMASADVEAAGAAALIAGAGSRDRPISGVIFKGIRFEYTAATGARAVTAPPAAVSFSFAGGIQFLEDEFVHMGTPAIALGPEVESCTVDGCAFADISWSAVEVRAASRIRIADSRISYVASEHEREGAVEVAQSDDVSVEHCQIDHFPSAAILRTGGQSAPPREADNLVSAPMIRFHGTGRETGEVAPPAGEPGVPQAYGAILGERFSSSTVPGPPSDVSAEAEDEFAYVTWIPSCLDGGSPVTSYIVAPSEGAKIAVTADDFMAKGYVAIGGLENGRAVTFTVSAVSALGASPPSLPTAAVTPGHKRRLKPPQAPAGIAVATDSAGSVVRITPPPADGGSPVTAYVLGAGKGGREFLVEGLDVIHEDGAHPVQRRLEGFPPPGASEVTVAARNAAGEGKPAAAKVRQ